MTEQPIITAAVHTFPDGRMNPEGAARYTGLSTKSLAIMRSRGEGPPFHKLGRNVFYSQADLDSWIRRCRVTSTAQARAVRAGGAV